MKSSGPKPKKMKKVTSVIAALFMTAVFTMTFESCGKYEEGPGFSLASKKGRLSREWVGDVYIDGASGTSVTITGSDVVTFDKDGKFTYTSGGASSVGTWEFSSNKENLLVSFTILGVTSTDTSKIIRLTSKELWTMETDGSNDETRYKAK